MVIPDELDIIEQRLSDPPQAGIALAQHRAGTFALGAVEPRPSRMKDLQRLELLEAAGEVRRGDPGSRIRELTGGGDIRVAVAHLSHFADDLIPILFLQAR